MSDSKISLQDYLNDFIPSLENFCSKSPLQMSCKFVVETGQLELSSRYLKENLYLVIDPFKDKKVVIKEIKTLIEKDYPIIFDHTQVPLSREEQEILINKGLDIRDILEMRSDIFLPRYKILRVHNKYNEIDTYDFKFQKTRKFKVDIPLVSFLDKIFTNTRSENSALFKNNTVHLCYLEN